MRKQKLRQAQLYWRWIRRQPILRLGTMTSLVWVPVACLIAIVLAMLSALAPNEFGDFLSGLFAPLAFMWLALGLLAQMIQLRLQRIELRLQRKELALQREEVKRLADEAERQANAIEATERHTSRDAFIRLVDLAFATIRHNCHGIVFLLRHHHRFVFDMNTVMDSMGRGNHDAFVDQALKAAKQEGGNYLRRAYEENEEVRWRLQTVYKITKWLHEEAQRVDGAGNLNFLISTTPILRLFDETKKIVAD